MKKEILFSQEFSEANPDVIMREAEELSKNPIVDTSGKIPSFEELMRDAETKYQYKPRPHAKEQAALFVALAKNVSTEFEIDVEITQDEHSITADFFIYYGPYAAYLKRALDMVVFMADDICFFGNKDKPNGFTASLSYHTHDRFVGDKKLNGYRNRMVYVETRLNLRRVSTHFPNFM